MSSAMQNNLSCFYEVAGIPVCVVQADDQVLTAPHTEEPFLPRAFLDERIAAFHAQGKDESSPLVFTLGNAYFLGIAKLSAERFLFLGPATPFSQTREQILSYLVDVIYPEKLQSFCDLLQQTSATSYRRFLSAFSLAIQMLSGRETVIDAIMLANDAPAVATATSPMDDLLLGQREHMVSHTPQSYEIGVLAAIESGDVPLLKRRFAEPVSGRIGQMAGDMLTQEKYAFIAFITMVTRAAIKGGLDQESAFILSDMYCQQMDATTRIQDIDALIYRMALHFCEKVHEESAAHAYSKTVRKMCAYISTHTQEKIGLEDLAAHCELNAKGISKKFREETGLSVTEYIHQQKMKEAAHLLAHSDYGIADIASFLQYSSQSYFTKVYRETYGVTPQQYKSRH